MTGDEQDLAEAQRAHWQSTYAVHPGMYGAEPSAPAVHAAAALRVAGARDVLELGAGHGRDALYFARRGFTVWEHGGFAVHFFDRAVVDSLAEGWSLDEVHAFEEGDLPRRLWRVTQTRPR
ncbi:hypothetical protein [Streptomyces humi]|uniref:hypothetical protein n=1 Tax=Streptomyces humi TaxID=1428620 RepID=UPI0006289806|nr:hypothetical protein [Streptomyces humi]